MEKNYTLRLYCSHCYNYVETSFFRPSDAELELKALQAKLDEWHMPKCERPQPDFAAKQEVSNAVQKAMVDYQKELMDFQRRLYKGEMWDEQNERLEKGIKVLDKMIVDPAYQSAVKEDFERFYFGKVKTKEERPEPEAPKKKRGYEWL